MSGDYHVIIPARLKSSRLPEKALANIDGYPMIVHTAKRAMLSNAKSVTVATDADRIHWVCRDNGIETVNTGMDHRCGTDRIHEAADRLNLKDTDVIINVQGDEPFVRPAWIQAVADFMQGDTYYSCCIPWQYLNEEGNINRVKVATSGDQIIGMSRLDIPYSYRKEGALKKHLSIIGFRRATLRAFQQSGPTPLEEVEGIEMLRMLELGMNIGTFKLDGESLSVDTPDDLETARSLMPIYDLIWRYNKWD